MGDGVGDYVEGQGPWLEGIQCFPQDWVRASSVKTGRRLALVRYFPGSWSQFLARSPDPGACLPASACAGIGDKQLATWAVLARDNASE